MKRFVKILCVFVALASFVSARPANWKEPDLNPFKNPISKARWIWFQAPSVAANTNAYYRYDIDLDEKVKSAWFTVLLDDGGNAALNGVPLSEIKMSQPQSPIPCRRFEPTNWKIGRNALSFSVRNGEAMGGMIMRGEITLASGKVIKLFSNKETAKAAAKVPANWREANFDDSAWQSAMELGDTLIEPWKSVTAVMTYIMDDEDWKKYNELMDSITDISFLKNEPDMKAKIAWNNDAAGISVNGEPMAPMVYLIGGNPWIPSVADEIVKVGKSGVRFMEYQFKNGKHMLGDGKYDFSDIDRDIRRILVLNPDALLFVAMRFDLVGKWADEHPEEMIGYALPKKECWPGQNGRYPSPSMASEKFRKEMQDFAKAAIEHIRKQDYYKRVIAIRTSHGVYSEWHYYGMSGCMPDVGEPMTLAFRKFLRKKYDNDVRKLRAAWHDEDVTFELATCPNVAERWGKKRFFRDPTSEDRKTLDYYECHENVVADTLLGFAGAVKSVDPRLLVGAYYGYFFCMGYPAEGQTLMLDKVLSSPNIDFLSSPYSYDMASRRMGGDGLPRMLLSPFKRYGKLAIIEADERTHIITQYAKKGETAQPYISSTTPEESVAIMRRESANAWLNGCAVQWLEFDAPRGRKSWFDDPGIHRTWKEAQSIWRRLFDARASIKRDAVVVFSPEEMTRHGYPQGGPQRGIIETIIDKPMHALFASGYTFDVLTLSDFLAQNHDYKVVAFMNVFSPTAVQRAEIAKRINKPGMTTIWGYAPGFVTEEGYSEKAMKELTGMELSAIHERLPMQVDFTYGGNMKSIRRDVIVDENPRIVCKEKNVEVLAKYTKDRQIAIAAKKLENGASVIFCGMPIQDSEVWAALFKRAGMHRYVASTQDVAVFGNERYLMVHVGKKGAYEVMLPRKAKSVKELFSNEILGKDCDKLLLRTAPCGATWFMEIEY